MSKPTQNIDLILKEFDRLPKFPDGRKDYSNSDKAPVLTCFVRFEDEILLLKRSERVRTHKGIWHTVAGYIDEPKPIRQKALEELEEELDIHSEVVSGFTAGEPYEFFDEGAKKSWIVHPVLVELKNKPVMTLDWEHTEFKWISPNEVSGYDTVPKLDESLKRVL